MTTNLKTSEWGPAGWRFLHFVAHGCPDQPTPEQAEMYIVFFTSLQHVLPCKLCRDSYRYFLSIHPVRASTKVELCHWLWQMHNLVNQKLNVTYCDADFKQVYHRYELARASCSENGCTKLVQRHRRLDSFLLKVALVGCALFSLVKYRDFYLSK